jgi:uncharacterized protein
MEPWIQTFTGREFWFLNPSVESVDIIDIAHSLSLQCRYNGHCSEFYSVAEHSVLASHLLDENSYTVQLWGLLHDSAEAYVSDVPAPVKKYIPGLAELERTVMRVIAKKFNLPLPVPKEVKVVDLALLHMEHVELMKPPTSSWDITVPPANVKIDYWSPKEAKEFFLERFAQLLAERSREEGV